MFKGIKNIITKQFNLKAWLNYNQIKHQAKMIKTLYTDLSPIKKHQRLKQKSHNLSFEELMQFRQITDKDIRNRIRYETKLFWGYLIFALFPLAYAIFILAKGIVLGGIIAFLVAMLIIAYAFQSRIYISQLTHKRFSVSFREILEDLFVSKKR